jgi:hypothetical protein
MIVTNVKVAQEGETVEAGDTAAEVIRRSMKQREIRELVYEALKLRRVQAKAIQNDRRDSELLSSPWKSRAVEAEVGCLAADVVAGPRCSDVLGITSDGLLEALDGEVRSVESLV